MVTSLLISSSAAPKWESNPQDLVVGVDETATVNCGVTGDPAPTVKWFINGRPYEGLFFIYLSIL